MKRLVILFLAAAVVGAQAQQGAPSDVPRNHWAFEAVDSLFREGLLKGYPDGTFKGSRPASRYELAALLAKVNVDIQKRVASIRTQLAQNPSPQDRAVLENQIKTLKAEIDALKPMKTEISSLADRLALMRDQMASIRQDLGTMRQKTEKMKG